MVDRVGQQLGNYRLSHLLGQGGFADVYLAEHIHLDMQAAIKVLSMRLTNDNVEHFRAEARTIGRLVHPHIVRMLDFGVENGTPYLIMDYAPHGSLRQRHPKGTPLPLAVVVDYVKQVAQALQYAHEKKLIHRDIKPENMLLGENHQVLLSDFGIALLAQSTRYQSLQEVIGTAVYMAPEQLQGKPRRASDQYALGIVVYEWLCGERPFHGSFVELYSQHLLVPPPSLCEKVPELPPAVEAAVFRSLAKDPQQRFESVQAFALALEQAVQTGLSSSNDLTSSPEINASTLSSTLPANVPLQNLSSTPSKYESSHSVSIGGKPGTNDSTGENWHLSPPPNENLLAQTIPPATLPNHAIRGDQSQPVPLLRTGDLSLQQSQTTPTKAILAPRTAHTDTTKVPHLRRLSRRTALTLGIAGTMVAGGVGLYVASHNLLTVTGNTLRPRSVSKVTITPTPAVPEGTTLLTYRGHNQYIYRVVWSSDGTRIASESNDESIQVWDAKSGKRLIKHYSHTNGGMAWSPDGKYIASVGPDLTVEVWDVQTGNRLASFNNHYQYDVGSVAWSPDGTRIASFGYTGLSIWDAKTGQLLLNPSVSGWATWSPDGKRLLIPGANGIYVLDSTVGNVLANYAIAMDSKDWIADAVWSPDGKRIAVGTAGTVQILDLITGKSTLVYSNPHVSFTHDNNTTDLHSLSWSPDGKRIVVGIGGLAAFRVRGNIYILDVATHQILFTYQKHSGMTLTVAWSPDGTRIASGSEDNVQVWEA